MKYPQTRFLTVLLILCLTYAAHAQSKNISKAYVLKKNEILEVKHLVKSADFFTQISEDLGLGNHDEMRLIKETFGRNDYSYQKYEQFYKGIPVFGSAYTLRIKAGNVKRATGYYLPMINMDVSPAISTAQAIRVAKDSMNAVKFIWQDESLKKIPNYANGPETQLVIIDAAYPAVSEVYRLAYQVDLHSIEPKDKKRYFIDAQSGASLLDLPLLMNHAVPGKGQTRYYGEQNFTVDSIGPNNFLLRDLTRGKGNTVFSTRREVFQDEDKQWDLTNEGQYEGAVDAHYCTERFYDLMLYRFGWDGIDGDGSSMNAVIGIPNFVNALWDGSVAFFGAGDCNHGPLTTLEVVGHEFMHGITENTSGLVFGAESGAINESMSDIFGKALEYFEDSVNFKWDLGHSFVFTPYGSPFRSFVDPNLFNHPKYYKGKNWSNSNLSHTNSSVGNHWFYLVVNGGTGINEVGLQYNIEGIGMEKALDAVFHAQSLGLIPSSDYNFYMEMTLLAAEELFGEFSEELESIEEAWKTVGVIQAQSPLDLAFSSPRVQIDTCQAESYLAIEFTVNNVGDSPYLPEMNGLVELASVDILFNQEQQFDLVDTIMPGESISYSIDSLWLVADLKFSIVRLSLIVEEDLRKANNSKSIILDNILFASDDLVLKTETLSLSNIPVCFGENNELRMTVSNNSCMAISAGTPFDIEIFNEKEDLLWSQNYVLPNDLRYGETYKFTEYFDLMDFDAESFDVVLLYEQDVNPENNSFELTMPYLGNINSGYRQAFINDNIPELNFETVQTGKFELPVQYEWERYFGATVTTSLAPNDLCTEPEDLFAKQRVSIDFCVDTKDIQNPLLEFDLIQFRNELDNEFPELANNSNLVKVSWQDGLNDFEDIIKGQPEGELIHHRYRLPKEKTGLVSIEFFNSKGSSLFLDLFNQDASLLDNLAISDVLTSVDEILPLDFTLRPNPTSGLVHIIYEDMPEEIIVQNVHGMDVLRLKPNLGETELDVSNLPQGVYVVSLLYPSGFTSSLLTKLD